MSSGSHSRSRPAETSWSKGAATTAGGPVRRALVAGWFSLADGEATAGDLDAGRAAADWLTEAGIDHDVAYSPVFGDVLTLDEADPAAYTHLVFVCGPAVGAPLDRLLSRFAHCRRIALDVSVPDPAMAARFDEVVARDGRGLLPSPDLAFAGGAGNAWPVAALVTANAQPEYGIRGRHDQVHAAIRRFLAERPLAVSEVDTRVDPGLPGQRAAAQVAAHLSAADVVITTRLHGLVIGLRQGTPVVAVDPVAGGAKVAAQAEALRWPAVILPEQLGVPALDRWLDFCLSPAGAPAVARSRRRGAGGLAEVRRRLLGALGMAGGPPG